MTETEVELAALGWFQSLNFNLRTGAEIDDAGERADLTRVLLEGRLAAALHRLNPKLPHEEVEQVVRTLSRPPHPTLIQNNRWFHELLTERRRGQLPRFSHRRDARRAGAAHRLRRPGQERLARRAAAQRRRPIRQDDPAGPDPVPQRPAARGDRTEGPGRHCRRI